MKRIVLGILSVCTDGRVDPRHGAGESLQGRHSRSYGIPLRSAGRSHDAGGQVHPARRGHPRGEILVAALRQTCVPLPRYFCT